MDDADAIRELLLATEDRMGTLSPGVQIVGPFEQDAGWYALARLSDRAGEPVGGAACFRVALRGGAPPTAVECRRALLGGLLKRAVARRDALDAAIRVTTPAAEGSA